MTPAEIAARLTPAQKRALMGWFTLNGGGPDAAAYQLNARVPTMDALNFARLCTPVGRGHLTAPRYAAWRLTPLGAQVRAIVAQEAGR